MSIIIASGGGEIGRPGFDIETMTIDLEAIRLVNKKKPTILFIPTASGDQIAYCETVEDYFGKKLDCTVEHLLLIKERYSEKELQEKCARADMMYVGGGNSLRMMKRWRFTGFDAILKNQIKTDKILYGLSAGSICWFSYGGSFARRFINQEAELIRVRGLGLLPYINCPHYNMETKEQNGRREQFKNLMKKNRSVGIANDSCAAIEFNKNKYRIISAKTTAKVYKVYWKNGEYQETELNNTDEYRDIKELELY